ncbi:MAG: hypothetical protein AAGF91_16785 [Actinomycetota bacterium]
MSIGRRLHRAAHEIREIPVEVPELTPSGVASVRPHALGRVLVAAAPVVILVAVVAAVLSSIGTYPALDDGTTAADGGAVTSEPTVVSIVDEELGDSATRTGVARPADESSSIATSVDETDVVRASSTSSSLGVEPTEGSVAAAAITPLTPREEVALVTAAIQRSPRAPDPDAGAPESLPLRGELGPR